MNQRTLSSHFSIQGTGIHSGAAARVSVRPAAPDSGRVFRCGGVTIPAGVEYVVDTTRSTTLGSDGTRIGTVEHLLSALAGCGIDNCEIEVDGPEIPILDGSARPFVEAILSSGVEAQHVPARFARVREPLPVAVGASELRAEPSDRLSIRVTTEFDDWPEGAATVSTDGHDGIPGGYADRIAPARTFAFRNEVEMLIAAGLARGGSLDNALIVTPPDSFSTPLRVPAEWCAHKMLDVIGDLALLNARPLMTITAHRPGHRVNTAFAAAIRDHWREESS
jgi:UDP-3-O-[3-hydroxymyristoyl] N-acetylglucosamine deacetylase